MKNTNKDNPTRRHRSKILISKPKLTIIPAVKVDLMNEFEKIKMMSNI